MIFVTVGTSDYGFDRLIKQMDLIAGQITEEVVMQIGSAPYKPINARWCKYLAQNKFEDLCEKARVIVCHAGVGSILTALEHGKPVIAVPRWKKYREAVDDHQLDIAGEMEKEGRITVVCDVVELEGALGDIYTASEAMVGNEGELVKALKKYLEDISRD